MRKSTICNKTLNRVTATGSWDDAIFSTFFSKLFLKYYLLSNYLLNFAEI